MTTQQPQWHDSDQRAFLELVAQGNPSLPTADEEWELYVRTLGHAALYTVGNKIDPNRLRQLVAGRIKPQRVGAFTSRALARGLIEYTGNYVISTDRRGKNSGKPSREMRWLGHDPSP